ncbi:MAG: 30S ribosomal protein S5 [Planctomycetes bacterium]|nr:30S ribosomal protein S5 [Planctomycetota bacterium]
MAASNREPEELLEKVVKIKPVSKATKGGRKRSFIALVVVGNKNGKVGYGYGKANEVPIAIEKGLKEARKSMIEVSLRGRTIPHTVTGRFGAAKVFLKPASEGTGVIAGSSVRAVVEAAGIQDILTKSRGSSNPINIVKAVLQGLASLRSKEEISNLRGVRI